MEIYSNKDGSVVKYLHEDGSETCIKTVSSCNYYYNKLTNKIEENYTDRNKFSVFISSSVGCPVKCKMCYLTIKNYLFYNLSEDEIFTNVIDSIKSKIKDDISIRNKYIKICWMGMGDACFNLEKTYNVTLRIVDYVIKNKLAKGIDGVDIGTVLPTINIDFSYISKLEDSLKNIKRNKHTNYRPLVRVFYSLHSAIPEVRKSIIPKSINNSSILNSIPTDIVLHQIFLNGINDSEENIDALISFCKENKNFELRVLRYNSCKGSVYVESENFIKIIRKLNDNIDNIKYQISPGSEIKAACGQFIMKRYVKTDYKED